MISEVIALQSKVATLPTRNVRYLEAGSGRCVVLLHAFPLSADQWLPQLARVPPGWQFIAPDLRGFRGAGPAFGQPGLDGVTMDDYAEDVAILMSHLDIERFAVCGLSMGGYAALALMRRIPERIVGLMLADTRAGADSVEGRAGRDAMRQLLRDEGAAGVATAMSSKLLGETTRKEQPDLADALRVMITMNTPDAIDAAILALKDRPDATPQLAGIRCPTLVVCGEEDTITPVAESEALVSAIPGAALVRLPRAGHLSNLETPFAFSSALSSFLARL